MSMPTEIRIRRASGDSYAASGSGQRATCSWSPMEAARRCAKKIAGESQYRLERMGQRVGDSEKGVLYRFKVVPLCSECRSEGGGCPDCGPVMGDATYEESREALTQGGEA